MRYTAILATICICGLKAQEIKLRPLADTVGFAHTAVQMDSVVARIQRMQGVILQQRRKSAGVTEKTIFKMVIAPHDDYTYAGYMYPLALENIKAKTVILFGVAHKAKVLGLQDQLIFDSYTDWRGPYGPVRVSPLREEIISQLPEDIYLVNDSMQKLEHSVEAEIPFLQYYNRNVEIISILVPSMSSQRMEALAAPLAKSIHEVMKKKKLEWGKDIAFVISADAVHYGDEDWGGKNFAFYGADSAGYKKAVAHESEIVLSCMEGELKAERVVGFTKYTVEEKDYKEYKWTWCGRYSVPLGMLAAYNLCELQKKSLTGQVLGYETSLSNKHIPVNDLGGMGITAPAKIRHWVGYPAIGFK